MFIKDLHFFLSATAENPFLCLFQFPEAAYMPGLVALLPCITLTSCFYLYVSYYSL